MKKAAETHTYNRYGGQRRGLLAKIHIARKALDMPDCDYRDLLEREFSASTSAALSIGELQELVRYFESKGWRPESRRKATDEKQVLALRERAVEISHEIPDGETRLPALVRSVCGVDRLAWCKDVRKLERLLAVLGKIRREGR